VISFSCSIKPYINKRKKKFTEVLHFPDLTSPPQWEGRIFDSNEQRKATLRGRVSYDSVYHRVRIVESIDDAGEEAAFDVLTLADAKIEFIYNLRFNNCTRRVVNDPWRDFGILPDAQPLGEAYLGTSALPSGGLLITIWLVGFFICLSGKNISFNI
jgi:hypothetical protein